MAANELKYEANEKPADKNPRQVRAMGLLPVTVYKKGEDSKSYVLDMHNFKTTFNYDKDKELTLLLDKKPIKVMVQNVQKKFGTGEYLSAEFKAV